MFLGEINKKKWGAMTQGISMIVVEEFIWNINWDAIL